MTIHDVAERAGVSIATVSYALNGRPGIGDATRARVQAVAEELGYVPNSLARGLLAKRTNVIGLIIPHISGAYLSAFVQHMEEQARAAGHLILLGTAPTGQEAAVSRALIGHRVDALVVMPGDMRTAATYRGLVEMARKRGLPLIFLSLPPPGLEVSFVCPDLEEGQFRLVSHLIDRGLSRIAFLGGRTGRYYTEVRRSGMMRALQTGGLGTAVDVVGENSGYEFDDGVRAVREVLATCGALSKALLPEAFVAINDSVALGAYKALREAGIDVPGRVSLVGFDGIRLPTVDAPELTTARIPLREMAQLTVETISAAREAPEAVRRHLLTTELVIGESVR